MVASDESPKVTALDALGGIPYEEIKPLGTRGRRRGFMSRELRPNEIAGLMTRSHGEGGDLLVLLERGRAGVPAAQLRVLDSLGLKRRGDAALALSNQRTLGEIKKVQHLTRVIQFSKYINRDEFEGLSMPELIKRFGSRRLPGEYARLENGEFIRVESTQHSTAVVWSTPLGPLELLNKLTETSPLADADSGAVTFSGPSRAEEEWQTPQQVLNLLKAEDGKTAEIVSVPFQDFDFLWRRRPPASEERRFSNLPQVALIYTQIKQSFDPWVLEATGTPDVQRMARDVLAHSHLVGTAAK